MDFGRNSVPPRIVAVVMVLQRYTGTSDREAADSFAFDARWKYAAGALNFDHPSFVHTVLVDMRERLRRSERPNRIFDLVIEVAREAGLVGKKRVLDSTALYDAVATQDTVTLVRSALVGLLSVVEGDLANGIRLTFCRDDDFRKPGKPACDRDDAKARETLVDALAQDGFAALADPPRAPARRTRTRRRGACLRPSSVRTSSSATTTSLPSREASQRTASSPRSIPTRVTDARPRRLDSTATRGTYPLTQTPSSSSQPKSPRAMSLTQRRPWRCSKKLSTLENKQRATRLSRSTATAPMAPQRSASTSKAQAQRPR